MRKNLLLFAIMLFFSYAKTTLAQSTESAIRMDIVMTAEDLSFEKANLQKDISANKPADISAIAVKPVQIEISNAPLTTNKITKGERIKKNLKITDVQKGQKLSTLGLVGVILIAVGLIFIATIILYLPGIVFLIIGLVLLVLELVK